MGRVINRTHRSMLEDSYYAGSSAPAVFDPATISLTGWWRDFSASPWVGTASAGSSAANDLTEGTNPPSAGTALNGHGTADFDGTNDVLLADGTGATYLSLTAGSGWVLFNADAATADAGAGSRQNNPQFFVESNGTVGIGFSSAGIHVFTVDGSNGQTEKVIACGTGGWHLLKFKYSLGGGGLTLSLGLDGGAFQDVTSAFGAALSGTLSGFVWVGPKSNGASPFFNGRMADMGIANTVMTSQNFTDVLSYINSRYGLSLS